MIHILDIVLITMKSKYGFHIRRDFDPLAVLLCFLLNIDRRQQQSIIMSESCILQLKGLKLFTNNVIN